MKLKQILLEDTDKLLTEDIRPWPNADVEKFLQSFNDVDDSDFVGSYRIYKIKNIKGAKSVKEIDFYQSGKYFLPGVKNKDAAYKYESAQRRLVLYTDLTGKVKDGYLISNNGIAEYQTAEAEQAKVSANEPKASWWDRLKSTFKSDELWDSITGVLDWTGFIEYYGIGAASDAIALTIHLAREKWFDAALSALGIIPFASSVIVPIKRLAKSNKQLKQYAEAMGSLKSTKEKEAAREFWSGMLATGQITTKELELVANGYDDVAKWILKNGPAPSNTKLYTTIGRMVEYLKASEAAIRHELGAVAKLPTRTPLKGAIIDVIKSPKKLLDVMKVIKAPFKIFNYLKFSDDVIKVMRTNLMKRFVNVMVNDPSKLSSTLKFTTERVTSYKDLIGKFASSNNASLNNLVSNITQFVKRSPDGKSLRFDTKSMDVFAKRFSELGKDTAKKADFAEASKILTDWLDQTKNPFWFEFINSTSDQLKTIAGATKMGWDSYWNATLAALKNGAKWADIIGSEGAAFAKEKLNWEPGNIGLNGQEPVLVGSLLKAFYRAVMKGDATEQSIAKEVEDAIYTGSDLNQPDVRIPADSNNP